MFQSEMLPRLIVRLPIRVRDWIADEAHKGRRSMNSVVIEAVNVLIATRAQEQRGPKHDAAVTHALASTELSHCDCIISKSRHHAFQTELLVQEPVTGKLSAIACITDEHIHFFTDEMLHKSQRFEG